MTDERDDLLGRQLSGWFDGEVRQAAADLRRAPLRPARARRVATLSIVGPAAAAILVVIVVVAGISRLPSLTGTASEPPSGTAPASVSASQPASTATAAVPGAIEGRYADGIPQMIDGEAVLRPSNIQGLGPTDDRSFLLGGWTFDFLPSGISCPWPVGLICVDPYLAETPVPSREASRVLVDGWTIGPPAGPVVVRVHLASPIETRCEPAEPDGCVPTVVPEAIVWAGDDATATAPLTPIDALFRLVMVDQALLTATLWPVGPADLARLEDLTPPPSGIVAGLPDLCGDPYPQASWMVSGAAISYVLVFPSTAARVEADLGPEIGVRECPYLIELPGFRREWVAVDNVMVAVRVSEDGKTPAQAALIEAVRVALEQRQSTDIGDRYRDGIPQTIDGQPVLRQGVLGHEFPADDSSFLIGGWLLHAEAARLCPVGLSPLEPCVNPVLSRTPLERADALPTVLGTHRLEEGPVVLRVHVNDQRAIDCRDDVALACRAALVVEEVLWIDDEISHTAPIGTIHAMRRLASLVPGLDLTPVGTQLDAVPHEHGTCEPGFPVQTWVTTVPGIAQVLVFPSLEAREAVEDNFTASGFRGRTSDGLYSCMVTTDSFYSHTWVARHNVMVAVNVDVDGPSPAQQALIDQVAEALREP